MGCLYHNMTQTSHLQNLLLSELVHKKNTPWRQLDDDKDEMRQRQDGACICRILSLSSSSWRHGVFVSSTSFTSQLLKRTTNCATSLKITYMEQ